MLVARLLGDEAPGSRRPGALLGVQLTPLSPPPVPLPDGPGPLLWVPPFSARRKVLLRLATCW